MQDLKVALVQTNLQWEDRGANLEHLDHILGEIKEAVDLIILPEMFSTGFTMEADAFSEDMGGPSMQWMAEQATKHRTCVTGSLIIEEEGNFYNRLFWYREDGSYAYYDKRHLFTLAGEEKIYSPGKELISVELNGWKIRPLVCYDLRFPVWCRNDDNYDLMLFVANWPERRIDHWRALLIARAIENQAFVIGVNRVGDDGNEVYHNGNSMIISPSGKVLEEEIDNETIIIQHLKYDAITGFRSHLTALKDKDDFEIKRD